MCQNHTSQVFSFSSARPREMAPVWGAVGAPALALGHMPVLERCTRGQILWDPQHVRCSANIMCAL